MGENYKSKIHPLKCILEPQTSMPKTTGLSSARGRSPSLRHKIRVICACVSNREVASYLQWVGTTSDFNDNYQPLYNLTYSLVQIPQAVQLVNAQATHQIC